MELVECCHLELSLGQRFLAPLMIKTLLPTYTLNIINSYNKIIS